MRCARASRGDGSARGCSRPTGGVTPVHADDGERLKALEQKLDASLRTIEALQRKVEQLERRDAGVATAGAADGGWGARLEDVERSVAQIGSAAAQVDTGLPVHGFADVVAGTRNAAAARLARRGFASACSTCT